MALSSGTRQVVKMATGWTLAAGCTVAGVVCFGDIRTISQSLLGNQEPSSPRVAVEQRKDQGDRVGAASGRLVELRAGAYGHYHTSAEINGGSVNVMVDTGASMVALSFEDASRAGLFIRDSDFTHRVSTANGFARMAPITIDRISVGGITVRNVPGAVMEAGKLGTSLLGMSFLSRLQRVDMRSGMLVLQE